MFANYLAAALRGIRRDWFYAGLNVGGLAVALAAAILVGLFVQDEFSYDRFIPGYQDVYKVSARVASGSVVQDTETAPLELAAWLKLDFPEIEAVTRLMRDSVTLKRGDIEAEESVFWADPDTLTVLPLPAIAGDVRDALRQPDGIVITRHLARKYFGKDDPVGETIMFEDKPMRITAVLEDLPSNTHLRIDVLASNLAPFSTVAKLERMPTEGRTNPWSFHTYIRLKPGRTAAAMALRMPDFIRRHIPGYRATGGNGISFPITAIADIHLGPPRLSAMKPTGNIGTIYAISAVAGLIVLIAGTNFVNLMSARAGRRAVEVGVRKSAGAWRRDLIVQFIGESVIYVAIAAILGLAVVWLTMPEFNAFLRRTISFQVLFRPSFGLALLGFVVAIGIAAGVYPAFVLSAFRPATVLRGAGIGIGGFGVVRQGLVMAQFAILIGLLVSTAIIYRQTLFAIKEAFRFDGDQMLLIETPCKDPTFRDEIRKLSGVKGAACSNQLPLGITLANDVKLRTGEIVTVFTNSIDFGFFELYGRQPLAGRFFSPDHPADLAPSEWTEDGAKDAEHKGQAAGNTEHLEHVVINETAARKFGFASADAAVGQTFTWSHIIPYDGKNTFQGRDTPPHAAEIIGVTPDFQLRSIHNVIEPAVFYVDPTWMYRINVRLSGRDVSETMKAIEQLWKRLGNEKRPLQATFLEQAIQDKYEDISLQGELSAIVSGIAVSIACLGLFGLSAFTAARRTKEIGIRRAMAASQFDILRLLLWDFVRPILLANLVAWPVVYLLMNRWLQGFAYHVDIEPWIFLAASISALAIGVATVSIHAWSVARAKPVDALRYE